MDNIKEYKAEEMAFISYLKREVEHELSGNHGDNRNTYIEKLTQLTGKGKLRETIEWIKNFIEIGNKLVVFTTSQFVSDKLIQVFPEISVKLTGAVSISKQKMVVNDFENNKRIRLLFCDLGLIDEGIKLSTTSYIAFYEFPWFSSHQVKTQNIFNGIEHDDKINIYFLFAAGSVEDKIARLLENKMKINDPKTNHLEVDPDLLLIALMNESRENHK